MFQKRQRGSILIWSMFLSLITSVTAISVLKQGNHQLSLVSFYKQRNEQDIQYERLTQELQSLLTSLQNKQGIPESFQFCFWANGTQFDACSNQEIKAVFSSPDNYFDIWLVEFNRIVRPEQYIHYRDKSVFSIYDRFSAEKFLVNVDVSYRHSLGRVFKWNQGYEVIDARGPL